MKRSISIICVTACLVVLAAGANAQQQLNFANLPLVNSPSPIPSGYGQLNWGNFFYVNPYGWSGSERDIGWDRKTKMSRSLAENLAGLAATHVMAP